jgi:hypothetical protein
METASRVTLKPLLVAGARNRQYRLNSTWRPREWKIRHEGPQPYPSGRSPSEIAHGEALSPDIHTTSFESALMVETLEKHPTTVAVGASEKRSAAAQKIDVLEPALDAGQAAQASNSIEKMLCHQMAAVHFTALRLIEKSAGDKLQPGEVARFTNAAARMIDVYQNGCLVLQKLKTKGTQRVVVQYQQVNVNEGGQAVVAGKIGARVQRVGSKAKKRR